MKNNSTEPQRTVAIMQPYFIPYIGYFQLIASADAFVFYDDVHFIKKGWLRRNKIAINGSEKLITVPCIGASQNKMISDVMVDTSNKAFLSMPVLFERAYSKCPFFSETMPIIKQIFNARPIITIAEFNVQGIQTIMNHLGLKTPIFMSSSISPDSIGSGRVERLARITQQLEGNVYLNPPNGTSLYSKEEFAEFGLQLQFHQPQFSSALGSLSIIHVLMNHGKTRTIEEISKR